MSTTARKARKAAGVKFVRTPKVGTPIAERAWFTAVLPGLPGTRNAQKLVARSLVKRNRALKARGLSEVAE